MKHFFDWLQWIAAPNTVPWLVLFALGFICTKPLYKKLRHLTKSLKTFSRKPSRVLFLVFLLNASIQAALSGWVYSPVPRIHDEYSYLLAADTFASGRLTNPTPPSPEHFASFHILVEPTYMSKYPPGQGFALAVGQALFGKPIVGAWLTTAIAVSAMAWALMIWMGSFWGLIGGLLLAVHPIMFEWGQSFWGGGVALLGGALVTGAVGRLRRRYSSASVAIFFSGSFILANSRPYEGMVFVLLAGLFLLSENRRELLGQYKKWVPIGFVFACLTLGWLGLYNYRVTGNPMEMPYARHAKTYSVAPNFLWQSPKPMPKYERDDLEMHYAAFELWQYTSQKENVGAFFFWVGEKLSLWLQNAFRLKFLFFAFVAFFFVASRNPLNKKLLLGSGVFVLAILQVTFFNLHYTAPAIGLLSLIVLVGLKRIWLLRFRGREIGRFFVLAAVFWAVLPNVAFSLKTYIKNAPRLEKKAFRKDALIQTVREPGVKHLIFMPCAGMQCPVVANEADIEGAEALWVLEMGSEADQKLINYFNHRKLWRLVAKRGEYSLRPYAANKRP